MPPTLEQILSDAESPDHLRVVTARILIAQDLLRRHEELDAQLTAAIEGDSRENRDAEAPRLQREIEALQDEIEAAKVAFSFRAVGKRKWSDLLRDNPPTQAQLRAEATLDHNPETFPVAAIAASCIEPELTLADAKRLESALNFAQFNALWVACVDANVGGLEAPKSVAAGLIRRMSAAFANTPAPAASLDQSSSAA